MSSDSDDELPILSFKKQTKKEQAASYKAGEIIWVKCGRYPYWPAVVTTVKVKNAKLGVKFFPKSSKLHTTSSFTVDVSKCEPYKHNQLIFFEEGRKEMQRRDRNSKDISKQYLKEFEDAARQADIKCFFGDEIQKNEDEPSTSAVTSNVPGSPSKSLDFLSDFDDIDSMDVDSTTDEEKTERAQLAAFLKSPAIDEVYWSLRQPECTSKFLRAWQTLSSMERSRAAKNHWKQLNDIKLFLEWKDVQPVCTFMYDRYVKVASVSSPTKVDRQSPTRARAIRSTRCDFGFVLCVWMPESLIAGLQHVKGITRQDAEALMNKGEEKRREFEAAIARGIAGASAPPVAETAAEAEPEPPSAFKDRPVIKRAKPSPKLEAYFAKHRVVKVPDKPVLTEEDFKRSNYKPEMNPETEALLKALKEISSSPRKSGPSAEEVVERIKARKHGEWLGKGAKMVDPPPPKRRTRRKL